MLATLDATELGTIASYIRCEIEENRYTTDTDREILSGMSAHDVVERVRERLEERRRREQPPNEAAREAGSEP